MDTGAFKDAETDTLIGMVRLNVEAVTVLTSLFRKPMVMNWPCGTCSKHETRAPQSSDREDRGRAPADPQRRSAVVGALRSRPRAAPWIGMARPRWPERTGEARSPGQLTRFALALKRDEVFGTHRPLTLQCYVWRTASAIALVGLVQKPTMTAGMIAISGRLLVILF